jgi:fibronectin type 3 domain-containing protein
VAIGVAGALLAGGLAATPAFAADAAPLTSGQFDFTTTSGAVQSGYTADRGLGFDATRGFGWVNPTSKAPISMALNTRARTTGTDQRLKTVDLMQGKGTSDQPVTAGAWEVSVVNGTYDVTVAVGDYGFYDSTHRITAEGVRIVNDLVGNATTPFRTVTAPVTVTDGKLTLDPTGGVNTKIAYVTFAPVTPTETVPPTVGVSVTGSGTSSATFTVNATDASGIASRTISVNGAAATPYTAPLTITAPGSYSVTATATDTNGNSATSAPATATVIAAAPTLGRLAVTNPERIPYDDRLVFNRIQKPEPGTNLFANGTCCIPANIVKDTGSFVLTNTGTGPLKVTGLSAVGSPLSNGSNAQPFQVTPAVALPVTLPVGGTLTVPVKFVYSSLATADIAGIAKTITGTLTVTTDDPTQPTRVLQLSGLWQPRSEHGQEPFLNQVVAAFGYTSAIPTVAQIQAEHGGATPLGDEVISGLWQLADTSKPLVATQIAAYHGQGGSAAFRIYNKGLSNTAIKAQATNLYHNTSAGQMLLPPRNPNPTGLNTTSKTFSPTSQVFGFNVDSEFSEDNRNNATPDIEDGCVPAETGCGHHMRFWAVYDRAGVLVPNTYVMAQDVAGVNYDFQDNVFLLENLRPEVTVSPSTASRLPGAALTSTGFDGTNDGSAVTDGAGVRTGFTSTQGTRNAAALSVAGGTLTIQAAVGTNTGTATTQVNAVQLPFDATLEPFTTQARVVGPLTAYNAGSRAAGVYVGRSAADFLKLQVVNVSGTPRVQLLSEVNNVSTTVATTAALPTATGAVDLALVGDPRARTVTALYRAVNGGTPGAWVVVATYTPTGTQVGKVFSRQQQGGLLASAQGASTFPAVFDSFAVAPGDVRSPDGTAVRRYDVGASTGFTDASGRVWSADTGLFSPSAPNENPNSLTIANTTSDLQTLYRSYRGNVGSANPRLITYSIPGLASGNYRVKLHFAERYWTQSGKRLFSITAEGRAVAADLDLYAAAGGQNSAVTLTIPNLSVTDGSLTLALQALSDYSSLAGIEVFTETGGPVVDTTPPPVPTGLAAVVNSGAVNLTWTAGTPAAADQAGYAVYRSTTATVDTSGTPLTGATLLTTPSYTDSSAVPGTTYSYAVVAVDTSGNRSAGSGTAAATVADTTPPAAPTGVVATAGASSTTVTWAANVEADLAGYRVWRSTTLPVPTTGSALSGAALLTNRTFTDTTATPGTTYYYVVTATDLAANQSAGSAPVSATISVPDTTPPAAPTGLAATSSPTSVGLTWQANGEADLAGYRVFRGTAQPVVTTGTPLSGATLLTTASYTDTAVTPGTTYYYVVTAVDASGNQSAASTAVPATPPAPDTTPPGAPTGLGAVVNGPNVDLTWVAPGDADLVGYRVYRAVGSSVPTTGTPLSGPALLTGTAYTDTTAVPGTTYSYVVVAVDTSGNAGPASGSAAATVPVPALLVDLKVDYSDPVTVPAAGYVRDSGQSFGVRDNGMSFGWVVAGTATPLDLSADGRKRTNASVTDARLLTLVHMQQVATNPVGSWELTVPNGTYTVSAGLGDAGNYFDSTHGVSAEGTQLVTNYVPTSGNRFRSGTVTVTVTDGRLTIASTGTNVKIDYVTVLQVS